jgi:hypothetical protein
MRTCGSKNRMFLFILLRHLTLHRRVISLDSSSNVKIIRVWETREVHHEMSLYDSFHLFFSFLNLQLTHCPCRRSSLTVPGNPSNTSNRTRRTPTLCPGRTLKTSSKSCIDYYYYFFTDNPNIPQLAYSYKCY